RLLALAPRRRGGVAAGPRRRRASRLLARRIAPRLLVLEPDRAARRLSLRRRLARARPSHDQPARRRFAGSRRAHAPSLRELRRAVGARLPLRAGGRRAVP